jgi:uncharacterized membrane protein YhaH (DUF805 family)
VQKRSQAWSGALAVTLIAIALAILDSTDRSLRRWWAQHAFTTSVVSGILVVLVTVLIVNRVVTVRQLRDRSRAIAAQAVIVMSQAVRATRAVVGTLGGEGDLDGASEELRTYLTMLLIAAPVLIDATLSRTFLEEAQQLAGELARAVTTTRAGTPPDDLRHRLTGAVDRLREGSQPLLQIVDPEQRIAGSLGDLGLGAESG